jgi:hypothetical protein
MHQPLKGFAAFIQKSLPEVLFPGRRFQFKADRLGGDVLLKPHE